MFAAFDADPRGLASFSRIYDLRARWERKRAIITFWLVGRPQGKQQSVFCSQLPPPGPHRLGPYNKTQSQDHRPLSWEARRFMDTPRSTPVRDTPLTWGLPQTLTPQPFVLVIFGAAGDLSRRKLLLPLLNPNAAGVLPSNFAMVG